jgi:two-component system response regulator DevR
VIDPGVTERLLDPIRRVVNEPPRDEFAGLTGMEREILGLIAQGKTNEEIAAAIDYSARTVKGHVNSILARLGLQRRVQIAAYLTRCREARYL